MRAGHTSRPYEPVMRACHTSLPYEPASLPYESQTSTWWPHPTYPKSSGDPARCGRSIIGRVFRSRSFVSFATAAPRIRGQ
jgi:hypothetical protein